MGTNYYLHQKACQCCKKSQTRIHIGKSSMGWAFSLHISPNAYDDPYVPNFEAWKALILDPENTIFDEYGEQVEAESMLNTITNRSHPKGLWRHDVDGRHCTANGEGTYDYCTGDFS